MNVGDKAPEILGLNEKGEEIRLSDYKGKKVVLYFYPKDMTSGCTAQACNLRDNYAALKRPEITSKIYREKYTSVYIDCRYRTKISSGIRRMGREKHVRKKIYGYIPNNLYH